MFRRKAASAPAEISRHSAHLAIALIGEGECVDENGARIPERGRSEDARRSNR